MNDIIIGNGQVKKVSPLSKTTESLEERISKEYALWLADDSLVEEYSQYNIMSAMLLVRVFAYIPWDNPVLKGSKGSSAEDGLVIDLMHVSPYAKVLSVGEGVTLDVKAGEVLKLQDHLTMTIKNPGYDAWLENDLNKSNAKKIGEQPPRMLQPILGQYKSIFSKNGLNPNISWDDRFTLLLPQSFFTCKIDVEA
jgi:hypothetical protein